MWLFVELVRDNAFGKIEFYLNIFKKASYLKDNTSCLLIITLTQQNRGRVVVCVDNNSGGKFALCGGQTGSFCHSEHGEGSWMVLLNLVFLCW